MGTVKHNGYLCEITRIWDGGYYDMKTLEPTEKGIIEIFLSVHWKELIEEGNNII